MVTSRMVSNIYYGTVEHLRSSLDRLVVDGRLQYYCYCYHRGERVFDKLTDSWVGERLKDHIHVGIQPDKRLDLMAVYSECMQLLDGKVTGFTRNWEFVRSQSDFWLYLYHDVDYCNEMQLIREYNYKVDDVYCSDDNIKARKLYDAKLEFSERHCIKRDAMRVVDGRMSELEFFSHNVKNAYGSERVLRAAQKVRANGQVKDDYARKRAFCSLGL